MAKTFGHSFACTQPNDSDEIQCLGFGGIANREMAHRLEGITNVMLQVRIDNSVALNSGSMLPTPPMSSTLGCPLLKVGLQFVSWRNQLLTTF